MTTPPAPDPFPSQAPTYAVRTLGCQMNEHDSQRIAGLLEAAGYTRSDQGTITHDGTPSSIPSADVVVLNTCAVREAAATRLFGNLGQLAQVKADRPGMQIAVGGCLAQLEKDRILTRAPWVDVVFGTHTIGALPALLARARTAQQAQIEIAETLDTFPSAFPSRRDAPHTAWVIISVGCNNACTFCIVPQTRGRERDRRPDDILAEVEALAASGVIEITLLGQNVNTYGVEFGERAAFAQLLRQVGAVEGIERVRFTSPHPAAFTDDVIDAMAETPTVAPQLHMPLQSGSDRILKAMRRSYRADRFAAILARVRKAIPHAAISTDVIVGFPGETEEDFAATLEVVERSRFASAFTFHYSPRPGTPAAALPDPVPPEVVADRYRRLTALQERISEEENAALVGREVEVLIAPAEGRKDETTRRISGRAFDGRLVHLALPNPAPDGGPSDSHQSRLGPFPPAHHGGAPDSLPPHLVPSPHPVPSPNAQDGGPSNSHPPHSVPSPHPAPSPHAHDGGPSDSLPPQARDYGAQAFEIPGPGDIVRVRVTGSAPHHLIADSGASGGLFEVRRTRASGLGGGR